MARTIPTQVIEIPTKTGLRGKIERLFHEFHAKAQALRITAEILDEDERKMALAAAPKKYLAAMNHRGNGHVEHQRVVKAKKPTKAKPPIHGKPLTLFLLEHLDETPRPATWFREQLAAAGSYMNGDLRVMNGPLGAVCARRGYAKKTADGYRITAKGTAYAATLRKELEAIGKVQHGGYTPA